jgi:hypothetical protein
VEFEVAPSGLPLYKNGGFSGGIVLKNAKKKAFYPVMAKILAFSHRKTPEKTP